MGTREGARGGVGTRLQGADWWCEAEKRLECPCPRPTPSRLFRSMFDLFVVTMSLISLGPISMPISVVRLMRAFR